MYGHPLKVTDSVKFLGDHIKNHLSMKRHVEHIEGTSLISRMRITRLNSISATLLIRLYEIFTRPYLDYACTALTALNKTQRQKLEVIQNCCFRYAKRAVDSTCISNSGLRSRCSIVSVEQRVLALAESWWKKVPQNNDDIMNFTCIINQTTKQKRLWISSKVTGSSSPFTSLWFCNYLFYNFVCNCFLYYYSNSNSEAALLTLTCHFIKKIKIWKILK